MNETEMCFAIQIIVMNVSINEISFNKHDFIYFKWILNFVTWIVNIYFSLSNS